METRQGLFKKLGIFSGVAIGLFLVGKKHIALLKERRHREELDAVVDRDDDDFGIVVPRPGFPAHNQNLDYELDLRPSKYEGAGNLYSTRRQGDRFLMWAIIQSKVLDNGDDNDK
ncbi:hypothetical protein JNB11_04775 [Kocuria palustris]|nr:hypothetical protein [Kocuria palustris]